VVNKNTNIKLLVVRTESLDDMYVTVYFTRPIGFEYESGDWMDINFYDEQPSGGITYSFSSSPTEPELAITFKRGISPFKKRLQSAQPGTEMFISQYGNDYGFHLKENRSSVLLAGGIGIAPFMSMLKDMVDSHSKNSVHLIYLNKGEKFIFASDIDSWMHQLPNLRVSYIDTLVLSRKKREKHLITIIDRHAHHYFIAGPEGMVDATEHLLIDAGVNKKDIRIDSFGGY
jgi:ferredoxin-NADP reductase